MTEISVFLLGSPAESSMYPRLRPPIQDLSQGIIIYIWAYCAYLSNREPEIMGTINEINFPQPAHTGDPTILDFSLWDTSCGVCHIPT